MGSPPFLRIGGQRSCPRERGQPPTVPGSAKYSVPHHSPEIKIFFALPLKKGAGFAKLKKGIKTNIKPIYESSLILPLTENEKNNLTIRKIIKENITAPIELNEPLGTIQFIIGNDVIGEISILAPYTIERLSVLDYVKKIGSSYLNYQSYVN